MKCRLVTGMVLAGFFMTACSSQVAMDATQSGNQAAVPADESPGSPVQTQSPETPTPPESAKSPTPSQDSRLGVLESCLQSEKIITILGDRSALLDGAADILATFRESVETALDLGDLDLVADASRAFAAAFQAHGEEYIIHGTVIQNAPDCGDSNWVTLSGRYSDGILEVGQLMQSIQADDIFNDLTGNFDFDIVTELSAIDNGWVSDLYLDLLDYLPSTR